MATNRIIYFNTLLLVFVFFTLFELYVFHLLFIFFLLLPVCSLVAALPVCFSLRCGMQIPDALIPKGDCPVAFSAENRSLLPCGCARIRLTQRNLLGRTGGGEKQTHVTDVRFSVGPKQTASVRPALPMTYAGKVELELQRVGVYDVLGLFCLPIPKKHLFNTAESVYVLPSPVTRTLDTEETAELNLDSNTYSTVKAGSDPAEIFQLRDYAEGDAVHSVHWKLSGRMQRLIVRDFGLPLNPSLHFLLELNAYAGAARAERLIGTALAFSEYLVAREVPHRLSYLHFDGMLQTALITDEDDLAAALHELLALPACAQWSALEAFANEQMQQTQTHLIYMTAGAALDEASVSNAQRMLTQLIDEGFCRRITCMPDSCSAAEAARLRALGCAVQRLDGRIPRVQAETADNA